MLFVVALAFIFLLPILYIVMRALEVGPSEALSLLWRPRMLTLAWNTLSLTAFVTTASVLIGVGTAWVTQHSDLPWRGFWHTTLTLPFAIPAFVSGYSWIALFPNLEGFGGAALVLTLTYYPLIYLPVAATFRSLHPGLEEVALSLGLTPRQVFFRVTLPALRPAILAGALLVSLHLLAEFGPLAFMNYDTFTTAIYDQYMVAYNSASAAMLTAALLALCLLILGFDLLLALKSFTPPLAHPSSPPPKRDAIGRHALWVSPLFALLALLGTGVPVGSILYWLISGSSQAGPAHEIADALTTTVSYGLGGAGLATLFALPLVFLAVRHRGLFSSLATRLPYLIHSLPGLVIGLTFVFFAIRFVNGLYQTTFLLLLAYAVLYLPLAQSSQLPTLLRTPRALEEVAYSLGLSRLQTFLRVNIPILAPGIAAGFALVFLKVMSELTATLILRPTGAETLATRLWEHTTNVEYAAAAPYAFVILLASASSVAFLSFHSQRPTRGRHEP